jgi:hypothetical protein
MSRRLLIAFASTLLLVFGASAAYTMSRVAPGCQKCNKHDGCPQGFCYVDCANCCYNDPRLGTVCFR